MRELINIIIGLPPLQLSSDPAENAKLLRDLEKTSTAKAVKEQYAEAIEKYKQAVRPHIAALSKESGNVFGTDGTLSKAFEASDNDFLDPDAKNIALALILPDDKKMLAILAARCHEFSLLDHAQNHKDETAMALPMRLTSLEVAATMKSDLPTDLNSIFENPELHAATGDKKHIIAKKVASTYLATEESLQQQRAVAKSQSECERYYTELDKSLSEVLRSSDEYRAIHETASTNEIFNDTSDPEIDWANDIFDFDDKRFEDNQHGRIVDEILEMELDPIKHKALIDIVEKMKAVKEFQAILNNDKDNKTKLDQFEAALANKLPLLNKKPDNKLKAFLDAVTKILGIKTVRVAVKDATKSFLAGSSLFSGHEKAGSKRKREPEVQNNDVSPKIPKR